MEKRTMSEKEFYNNFNALSYDAIFFAVFNSFVEPGTVVASFVSNLTSSPVLIGLTTTIRNCGWFLPQLLVARRAEALPRKKPLVVVAGGLLRLAAGMMALSTLIAAKNPALALTLFYVFFIVMAFSDGVGGVPWIDLFAKSIPPERRGTYYTKTLFLEGSLAFGAGFLVKAILSSDRFSFPYDYSVIFLLGFICCTISYLSFLRLKEVEDGAPRQCESLVKYLMGIPQVFKKDRDFRLLIVVNTLLRFFFMPLPFYVIFAQEALKVSQDSVGIFVSAQMLGYILAGVFFGRINDFYGSRSVVMLTAKLTAMPPVLALLSLLLYRLNLPSLPLYVLLFILIGATYSGIWVGIYNYLLKIAPEEKRPLYIGLLNTLTAPTTFLPLLGGVIIQFLSYVHLFVITAVLVFSSVVAAYALRELDA